MLWRSPVPVRLVTGWSSFIRRRVIRLYPALLGLVVVSVVLYAATPDSPLDGPEVARRGMLVLGQASAFWGATQSGPLWLPSLHPFAQTWSLAIEWYFYLLWPLAVLGCRMRGWGPARLATVSLGVAAPLYLLSLPLSGFWFYFGPSARFAELLAGSALALWFQANGTPTRSWRHATPASVLALAGVAAYCLFAPSALSPAYRYLGIPVAVLATVVLIYAGYSNQGGPVYRLLSHPWLATVGRYSYSLYLWHVVPMQLLAGNWLGLPTPVLGLIAVASAVALTIASYQLLERPFLRPRSDVLRRGRVRQEGQPARSDQSVETT